MKKMIISLVLAGLMLITGCSAGSANGKQPAFLKAYQNQIQINMNLETDKMDVVADYSKKGVECQSFMLNRSFEVSKILCDGQEVDINAVKEPIVLGDDYKINLYRLPTFKRDVHIEYSGNLDGTAGVIPYDSPEREYLNDNDSISPEFSLLRYKTVFHPLFADPQTYTDSMTKPYNLRMTVNVPQGYTTAFAYAASDEKDTSTGKSFTADLELPYTDIAASIAKYQKVITDFGDFYLLENSAMDISWAASNTFISRKKDYFKDSWFGDNYPYEQVNIIEIPRSMYKPDPPGFINVHLGPFLSFIDYKSFNFYFQMLPLLEAETEPIPFPKFEGDSCSILFVGDSYIIPIPPQLRAIARQYGIDVPFDMVCASGTSVAKLLYKALESIQNNQYDYVVVQDHIWVDADGNFEGISEIEKLFNAAKEKGSIPVLFNAADGAAFVDNEGRLKPEKFMRQIFTAADEIVAKRSGAILVNASQARVYAYEKIPDISLFKKDKERHSNEAGVYHNACVFAATLFDIQVKDTVKAAAYKGEDAFALGQAAWEYVTWYKEFEISPE